MASPKGLYNIPEPFIPDKNCRSQKIIDGCVHKIFGEEMPVLPSQVDSERQTNEKIKRVVGMYEKGVNIDDITRWYATIDDTKNKAQVLAFDRERNRIQKIIDAHILKKAKAKTKTKKKTQ